MFSGCYGLKSNILSFQVQMAQFRIGLNIACKKETQLKSQFYTVMGFIFIFLKCE